jgi:flagellar hook-basal body complex protein FliE
MSDMINPDMVTGDVVNLRRSSPGHFRGRYDVSSEQTSENFGDLIIQSLDDVNQLQRDHEELSIQAAIDPDSVDTHDITIALAKANTALNITKAVVDRVVQAYREITTVR